MVKILKLEIILFWIAVGFYAISTFLYVTALTFKKEKFFPKATLLVKIGLVVHFIALIVRWIEVGHGPYMTPYEVLSSNAWMSTIAFLLLQYKNKKLRVLGAFVMPAVFIMVGIAVMSSAKAGNVPSSFLLYWLIVHVLFAKLAYGSSMISGGLAGLYLYKQRSDRLDKSNYLLDKLPAPDQLDVLSYKFGAFAFIMLGVMIASGAVWANKAWGRYWGWDPVETWALISWLIYALYLHLRVMMGWKGKKAAWLGVFAFVMVVFSYFGITFIYPTVHENLNV